MLSTDEQDRLYALMSKIDSVLTQGGVPYWAGRETLLGARCYQGLRPWDDYLHLFTMDSEDIKLQELQEEFDKIGLVLHHYRKVFYKVFDKEGFPLVDLHLGILEELTGQKLGRRFAFAPYLRIVEE